MFWLIFTKPKLMLSICIVALTSKRVRFCWFSQAGHVLLNLSNWHRQPLCKRSSATNGSCEILLRWQRAHDMSKPVSRLKMKPWRDYLSQHSAWHVHRPARGDVLWLWTFPNRKLFSLDQINVTFSRGANSAWQQVHTCQSLTCEARSSVSQARSCHGTVLPVLSASDKQTSSQTLYLFNREQGY